MPTADRTEHDFLEVQAERVKTQHDKDILFMKEFLLGIVNERERKYEQRMNGFDQSFADLRTEIKEALSTATGNTKDALLSANNATRDALSVATANTKDALGTANANLASALISIDKRFDSVNEFRGQLSDQQEQFARKTDVEASVASLKEATLKYEAQVAERFDSFNAFRAQLQDQQATFARRAEADIRFEALDKKLDAAVSQLERSKGRDAGIGIVWATLAVIMSLLVGAAGVIAAVMSKH